MLLHLAELAAEQVHAENAAKKTEVGGDWDDRSSNVTRVNVSVLCRSC